MTNSAPLDGDSIEERTRLRAEALRAQLAAQRRLAQPTDYVYDKAQEAYWDLLDGTLHKEKAVDASIPQEFWRVVVIEPPERPEGQRGRPPRRREQLIKPSVDICRVELDQFVEGSTWWPGRPQIIPDIFVDGDGWRPAEGRRIYNQYREPPAMRGGDPELAEPWVKHVKLLWPEPEEHEYFFNFCAHMLQAPQDKPHGGIVLSGIQGIGKDSALQPVREAVGMWNAKDIDPDQIFQPFRPWLQTLMLVVNEAKPSDSDFSAMALYNAWKPWMAAPPVTLPVNDKHVKIRHVMNLLRVFITTNNWLDLYIPPDDRRTCIMHSHLEKNWHLKAGDPDYFTRLWAWLEGAGTPHVAAWLRVRDLSGFNPKREPPRGGNWRALAQTWKEPEDGVELALDKLGRPEVLFSTELLDPQFDHQPDVESMIRSPRKLARRMTKAGYAMVAPSDAERFTFKSADGLGVFRSRMAFVRMSDRRDENAARALVLEHGAVVVERMAVAKGKHFAAAKEAMDSGKF